MMKLVCLLSESMHECGCGVGNCNVCADLVEYPLLKKSRETHNF